LPNLLALQSSLRRASTRVSATHLCLLRIGIFSGAARRISCISNSHHRLTHFSSPFISSHEKTSPAPVIRNIHSSKSVIGLSTTSSYGEVIVYSNAAYYNLLRGNPFTAYGEVFMVLMQNFIVVLLIWIYREPKIRIVADVILPLVGYLIYLFVVFHGEKLQHTHTSFFCLMTASLCVLV
jgi:hypothetical protein